MRVYGLHEFKRIIPINLLNPVAWISLLLPTAVNIIDGLRKDVVFTALLGVAAVSQSKETELHAIWMNYVEHMPKMIFLLVFGVDLAELGHDVWRTFWKTCMIK